MFTRNSIVLSNSIKTPLTAISKAIGSNGILKYSYNFDEIIRQIFSHQEQGFAYDPNDLSTMFQDAAGTVPVTAAGQPVGLMLDKSKGLALGPELVVDGGFDSPAGWTNTGGGFSISSGKLYSTGPTNNNISRNDCSVVAGRFYKVVVNISSYTAGMPRVSVGGNVIDLGVGVGTKTLYVRALTTTSMLYIYSGYTGSGGTWEMESVSIKELAGNHAYQTTSASRPILRQNAVTGAYYLAFDGSDDFLQTSNIDFTSTDKVSLFAGVRKLSDSAGSIVALSTAPDTTNGTFELLQGVLPNQFGTNLRGTASVGNWSSGVIYNSPISAVISSKQDISGTTKQSLRINNVLATTSTVSVGTGNLSAYPLYVGRRAGTSLPFNGHIYSLIGIGRLTTDSETIALEKSIAKQVGVTL